jgi:hypothetical protein
MSLPLPDMYYTTEKMIRQYRVIEAAVDGMHMQREIDFIEEVYNELPADEKNEAKIKKARLLMMLSNCDNFLVSALKAELITIGEG